MGSILPQAPASVPGSRQESCSAGSLAEQTLHGEDAKGSGAMLQGGDAPAQGFPVQVGAGCILPNKPLHSSGSGGKADSSLPEKEAGSCPKAQNKSL